MLTALLKTTVLRNLSPRPLWWRLRRAVHNLAIDLFRADALVSRATDFRVRSSTELTPLVGLDEFASRRNAHVVAHPGATTSLKIPEVRGIDPAQVHFCGPYMFYPDLGTAPSSFPASVISPPLTLARLSDVLCIPGQIALAPNAAGAGPAGERVMLDASFIADWERMLHRDVDQVSGDLFRVKQSIADFEYLPGPHLYLDCQHRTHFGHFLVDVVTMAWAYDFAASLGIGGVKVLTSGTYAAFMQPLLGAMGIPPAAAVALKRPVRCEELLVASKCHVTQSYTSPVAIETWRRIRDALDRGHGPERVYVSRSRQLNRPLTNEREVEALFASRGFQVIKPERLSIEDQVTIWANARLVAGTAGSNMFGLAFQRRLERAFILNSPAMVQFSEIFLQAGHAGATTFYIGKSEPDGTHASWSVDLGDVEKELDRWLG